MSWSREWESCSKAVNMLTGKSKTSINPVYMCHEGINPETEGEIRF